MLKMKGLFAVFVLGLLARNAESYFYAIGPNVIRFNTHETVLVGLLDETDKNIEVWLEDQDGVPFSKRAVVCRNQESPKTVKVEVTEDDIFKTERELKPKTIKLVAKCGNDKRTSEVLLSYNTGYLVVQTDKPVYTPRQTSTGRHQEEHPVKVRVLPMTEEFHPAENDRFNVTVDIIGPSGLTFLRQKRENKGAFFQCEFYLPPNPETGIWTARAFFGDKYETEGRALFAVEEYVLPTFGVTIETNKKMLLPDDDDDLIITVTAKYVYKKPVQGKASILLAIRSPENILQNIVEIDKQMLSFEGDAEFVIEKRILCQYSDICENFPDGSTLVIEARVFEDATGNDEKAISDSIILSKHKYRFSFERTRTTYRKGMTFYVKANVIYPNGEYVTDKIVVFSKKVGDKWEEKEETTNEEGQVTAIFNTPNSEAPMEFMVELEGEKSDVFTVLPFKGDNQIQVEYVTRGGEGYIDAYTNRVGEGFTGIMFLLVSRGQVLDSFFTEIKTVTKTKLTQEQRDLVTSPTVRLIAFFIDKNSRAVVADSTKFKLPIKCPGNGLSLSTNIPMVGPGDTSELTIEGTPGMAVGLNVIDKALLLVKNSQEILKESKMNEVMDAHDIGCGDGSGETSELVFKNTGLTLITNAQVQSNQFLRDSESCNNNRRRRKRNIDDCETTIECCLEGFDFAENLNTTVQDFDPYTACLSLARKMANNGSQPFSCIEAAYDTCLSALEGYDDDDIEGKSFGSVNRYRAELRKISDKIGPNYVRDEFHESWMFENIELNKDGEAKKQLVFPDSITEWMVQAIGITKDQGFCVAPPLNITAYKDFFIQLDLPYQATRLENINIKATLFYYGQKSGKDIKASMYLDHNPDYCSNSQPNEKQMVPVSLVPNSAHTVRFPIIPIKKGAFEVIVRAIVADSGSPKVDGIKKFLYVKNEGIEEQKTIQICLDPLQQMEDCQHTVGKVTDSFQTTATLGRKQTITVDLTLPEDAIPQTGSATGYFSSRIMDGVVSILLQGVDKLLRVPAGCGEQTVIRLAPTVYAMSYLKTTKQITPDIEKTGHKYIRDGVNRELTFRKNDGSYGAWLDRGSSTWLTAFVAKVFCQAESFDSEVQIQQHIGATLNWLIQKTNIDGKFYDPLPVIHREMIGQINERDPTLTPFVMIALSECKHRDQAVNASIIKATRYLEKLDENTLLANPYLLAISTYALALANSAKKYEFKDLLMRIKNENGQGIHWGVPGGFPARAEAIETTSYALLATLQFDDITTSSKIVRWLTSQRNAEGSFRTTQDTVIGLQALSAYDIKTYSRNVDLDIVISGHNFIGEYKVTRENSQVLKIAKNLPVERGDNRLSISVEGTGSGRLNIDLRYNRNKKDDENCQLAISDVVTSPVKDGVNFDLARNVGRKCDICGNCEFDGAEVQLLKQDAPDEIKSNFGRKRRDAENPEIPRKLCTKFNIRAVGGHNHGMSIVNFGLETGVDIEKKSLDRLKEDGIIDEYEMPENGKGYLILYLNEITAAPINITLVLKVPGDDYDVDNVQPASIEVTDYYNPEIKCTKFYSTSKKGSAQLQKRCEGRKCKCLQNICAKDVTNKLKKMTKKQRPAFQLARHTCSPGEADYAVRVIIEGLHVIHDGTMKEATATVLDTYKNGSIGLEKGAEMEFSWMESCKYPDFEIGSEYFIIGLDGHKISGNNEKRERYLYELMNTAVIIKSPNLKKRRLEKFGRIMTNYIRTMRKGCLS